MGVWGLRPQRVQGGALAFLWLAPPRCASGEAAGEVLGGGADGEVQGPEGAVGGVEGDGSVDLLGEAADEADAVAFAAGLFGEADAGVGDGEGGGSGAGGLGEADGDGSGAFGEGVVVAVGDCFGGDHADGGDGIEVHDDVLDVAEDADAVVLLALEAWQAGAEGGEVGAEVYGAAEAGAEELFVDFRQRDDAADDAVHGALGFRRGGQLRVAGQHGVDELEVVADAVLQLLGQDIAFGDEAVFFGDGGFHRLDGALEEGVAFAGGDGFGEDVGEAGEEVDVVDVVGGLFGAVDFEDAEGGSVEPADQDVDGGDDVVLGVEGGEIVVLGLVEVVDDDGLAGGVGAALG